MASENGDETPLQTMRIGDASIADLITGLEQERFTSEDLVKAFSTRVEEVNGVVHAIAFLNPNALVEAKERDKERKAGVVRGGLHGIPILYKDLFLTKNTTPSTVGCSGLLHAEPKYEARVIEKLRESGAILLGSTVASQWAMYRSPDKAPNGWSAVGGQCIGIFRPDQDPGGSSAGSAVAVGLGLAPAALGTETSGSLAAPARSAGVVAIKPTRGLTSQHGSYVVVKSQDSAGVIAKSVVDAATVLSAISESESPDEDRPSHLSLDFAADCNDDGLNQLRVAVPRHIIKRDEFVMQMFNNALGVMESRGATIVEDAKYSDWPLNSEETELLTLARDVDMMKNVDDFLDAFEPATTTLHSFKDVMDYTAQTPEEENEKWGMTRWERCVSLMDANPPGSVRYNESKALVSRVKGQISDLLDRYECDVIAAPWWTNTTAPVAGCPQVSVPLPVYPDDFPDRRLVRGVIMGAKLPTGLMFIGRRWDDHKVIRAAHAFEVATQHRASFKTWITSTSELPVRDSKF